MNAMSKTQPNTRRLGDKAMRSILILMALSLAGLLSACIDRDAVALVQSATSQPSLSAPSTAAPDRIAQLRSHPHYQDVLAAHESYLRWPVAKWSESPERMLQTVDVCAQWHAFNGDWPRRSETLPILRRIRDEWPLPFKNFNHQMTLWHIPTIYRAASLSPIARAELDIPLRWCEVEMLRPQMVRKPFTAMASTNIGPGLQSMVMIRELLYGEESARQIALSGFGKDPTQWGLPRLLDECFDDDGVPRVDPAAVNHWSYTIRPALVWLLETKGYKKHLTSAQRSKWGKFYKLPCRLLCVGGKTFTIPGVTDDYAVNPVVGPVGAWVGDTAIDRWARYHARKQTTVSFDWLLVSADEGYQPTERPPGCKGDRNLGRFKLYESASETRVEYAGDGEIVHGGHRKGGPTTVTVVKP